MKSFRIVSTLICVCFTLIAYSNYDEAIDGDISGDPNNPTVIDVAEGSNIVCASSTAGDIEYWTITIPEGGTLDEIMLTSFTSQRVGFLAFQEGSNFVPGQGAANLLGWTHLGDVFDGQLDIMNSNGELGFSIPVPAGTYTFWAQETSTTSSTEFCLDFQITLPPPVVSEIPTMSEWGMIALGLLMLIFATVAIRRTQTLSSSNTKIQ